ncbi:uncharacterized protein LOC118102965 [Hippoglossus stenolepis]|uniref:uncharacterized protein LOC118102965 n=1 Tax=Hippoglossus stenolepis TaxID=195615 RepID=UPI001FAF56A9|nr:uncharacterized protein LOC118102965 [Hippoglossus stenolepis]
MVLKGVRPKEGCYSSSSSAAAQVPPPLRHRVPGPHDAACSVPPAAWPRRSACSHANGRCPFRQYMPSKPAKYGIKSWVACDAKSSYAWKMQVYTESRRRTPERNQGCGFAFKPTATLGSYIPKKNTHLSTRHAEADASIPAQKRLTVVKAVNAAAATQRALDLTTSLDPSVRPPPSCRSSPARVSNRSFVVLQHNWTQIFSGETISVRCEIQGGGDTQWEYEWRTTSSHQPVTGPNTAPTHSEYRLGTASVFHSGEYWCKARADLYSSTEWSDAFQLRVTPNKPRPRLTAHNTTITGKGSAALICSVDNAAEWRYDWFRRTSASSAAQILRYNETDDEISISEEGIYNCRGRRGDTTVFTEDSNLVTIENRVSHKASVALQPDWSLIFSGEMITVRCEVPADGLTEWEYEWTKPNSTTVPTHNEYRIVNASSSDSGSYRCLAKDKKNLTSTTEWSDVVTLTVSERPAANLRADHRAFPVGGSVLLTCSVGPSSPGWNYYWYRGEKTSEPLTDEDFKSDGQSASASREGQYWCRGGRGDPVYYTEYSHSVRIHEIVHNRAAVTLQPNWPNRYRGETVTLRCEIQGGDSEWEYEWTATSSHAPPNTKEFRISVGSHVSGSYWCQGRLKGARQNSTGWSVPLTLDLSNAAAPRPVVTVSPSWLTPGASVTLTCGVPHPAAGWRFSWYRVDLSSLNQVPRCPPSFLDRMSPVHIPYKYSYELLPGSNGRTEQNSSVIRGQTESAGYACRAGRGDPVFYTKYSKIKWVWSGDSYSSVSLTVSPDSVQHELGDLTLLTCERNSDKLRLWRFTGDQVLLFECRSHKTKFTWSMESLRSGVYCCESGSEISNAVNISSVPGPVILDSPARPVTEGQSVTLRCSSFGGNLYSNFSFYKNGELLRRDVRGKLEISAVSKSDEGLYKCEHSGDFSRESWMSVKCECDQYEVEKESPG